MYRKIIFFNPSAACQKSLKVLIILFKKGVKLTTKKKLATKTTTVQLISPVGDVIRQLLCNWTCPKGKLSQVNLLLSPDILRNAKKIYIYYIYLQQFISSWQTKGHNY